MMNVILSAAKDLLVISAIGVAVSTITYEPHALPYYVDVTLTPRFVAEAARDHNVGDFSLTDQRGRIVTRQTVAGRVYVASFFYTQCRSLCSELRDELVRVRDAFRGDSSVMILSHSVTPEADDVPALAHYAYANAIDNTQWLLLT